MKQYYFMKLIEGLAKHLEGIMSGDIRLNPSEFQGFAEFRLMISEFILSKAKLFNTGLSNLSPAQVILDLVECKKLDLPGFLPSKVFSDMVKKELEALVPLVRKFIQKVAEHNKKALKHALDNLNTVNPDARVFLEKECFGYLEILVKETQDLIEKIIEVEKDIIWTLDHTMIQEPKEEQDTKYNQNGQLQVKNNKLCIDESYVNSSKHFSYTQPSSIPSTRLGIDAKNNIFHIPKEIIRENLIMDKIEEAKLSPQYKQKYQQLEKYKLKIEDALTEAEVFLFYEKISKYFHIIDRNLSDQIPKIVGSILLVKFQSKLKDHLQKRISQENNYIRGLKEDPQIERKRTSLKEMIDKLKDAMSLIEVNKVRCQSAVRAHGDSIPEDGKNLSN